MFEPVLVRELRSGRITYFNRAAEALYGWSAAEAVGEVAGELLGTRFEVREEDVLRSLLESGSWEGRLVQRARDGSEISVAARWALVRDAGAPEAILETNSDAAPALEREREAARRFHEVSGRLAGGAAREVRLTSLNTELERQVAERTASLLNANQELEAFAYAVSHDLRTPLRALAGFSQALAEDCWDQLDEDGRDYVERIQRAAKRLGLLIDSFLVLSRISRQSARRQPVDISQMAEEVLGELRELEPGREVETSVEAGLTAVADPALLLVVVQNLLANAWKFTARSPRARIEVGRLATGQGPAFFVRDNGVGFDPSRAERLFQPFQRLHSAADFEGTGIGLASAHRAVRRHGGRVWAEARPGEGATFYFTLPDSGGLGE